MSVHSMESLTPYPYDYTPLISKTMLLFPWPGVAVLVCNIRELKQARFF